MNSTIFTNAIVRRPAGTFADGLSCGHFGRPDIDRALLQHDAYCRALGYCGIEPYILPSAPKFPDSTFVEDTAVMLPEAAIITKPGHPSRRGEIEDIRTALSAYREIVEISDAARIDGGDVLQADGDFFVGLSGRTNDRGTREFADIVTSHGYGCSPVRIEDCLHLKSVVNYLGDGLMIVDERYSELPFLDAYRLVLVTAGEAYSANCVRINDHVLVPSGFPSTLASLKSKGLATVEVEMSEFMKMDGGLSCLSLRF